MIQIQRNHFLVFVLSMLVFMSGCAGDRTSRSAGNVIDDAAISTKVKSNLLASDEVSGTNIQVETFKGDVQLSGFVDDHDQVKKAEKIASKVQGVRSITNNIIVKSTVRK